MLVDWYFCCCIESHPQRTQTFLSTLNLFNTFNTDPTRLVMAFRELVRMDSWMQIYALPQVLESIQSQEGWIRGHQDVWRYLHGLVEQLPSSLTEPFEKLILATTEERNPRNFKKWIVACADMIADLEDREITSNPYLDMKEFLPETLFFAALFNYLTDFPEFGRELTEVEGTQSIDLLFEKAVSGRFGRMALRLATQSAHLGKLITQDRLFEALCRVPYGAILYEPDLMWTWVTIRFSVPQSETVEKTRSMIEEVLREIYGFQEIRHLFSHTEGRYADVASQPYRLPLERIGLSSPPKEVTRSYILTYWQCVLWQFVVTLDVKVAAELLASHWQILNEHVPTEIHLSLQDYAPGAGDLWRGQLETMRSLRQHTRRVVFNVDSKRRFFMPQQFRWIFSSPWLQTNRENLFGQNKAKSLRYEDAQNPEMMLRLGASVLVSQKVLSELSEDDPHRLAFVALLAHADDVIYDTYRFWITGYQENADSQTVPLTLPITGFVLYIHYIVSLLGSGADDRTTPDDFIQLVRRGSIVNDKTINDNEDERVRRNTVFSERSFFDRILPEVYVRWIKDAYTLANPASKKWLSYIPEVYDYFRNSRHGFIVERDAALLVRYLKPDYPIDLTRFNWTQANDWRGPLRWNIKHRQLLLTDRLPARDWIQEDWDESEASEYTHLTRAIERRAVLTPDCDIDEELKARWKKEWEEGINRISEHKQLDRYIRLRLLEILKSGNVADSISDLELVSFLILEYGSIYDLQRLFEIVYPDDIEDPLDLTQNQRFLQQRLLYALQKNVSIARATLEDRQIAQPPQRTYEEWLRFNTIEQALARIAYTSINDQELQTQLRQLRINLLKERDPNALRLIEADIEIVGLRKQIKLRSHEFVQNNYICAAVQDPNKYKTALIVEDYEDQFADREKKHPLINLFGMSPDGLHQFSGNAGDRTIYVLAVLVDRKEIGRDTSLFVYNCGLRDYIVHERKNWGVRVGDYVALPIAKNNYKWSITEEYIYSLLPRVHVGDITNALTIVEKWESLSRHEHPRRRFRVYKGQQIYSVDGPLWDADLSRSFREFEAHERQVFAQFLYYDEQKDLWELSPVNRDLTDLLSLASGKAQNLILTYIGTHKDEFGQIHWLFARIPGENYLLSLSDFTPSTAEILLEELASDKDPCGLLVAFTFTIRKGRINLQLGKALSDSQEIEHFFPNLNYPIDDRNRCWRNLLDSEETQLAYFTPEQGWYIDLKQDRRLVPGYPDHIKVTPTKPLRNLDSCEFSIRGWGHDQWVIGRVEGEPIFGEKLRLKPEEYHGFLEFWLNLRWGDRLFLTKITTQKHLDKLVTGYTSANVRVQLEPDSLTMQPVQASVSEIDIGTGRWVEIVSNPTPKTSHLAEVDSSMLPDTVLSQSFCVGVIIEVPSIRSGQEGRLCHIVWQTETDPVDTRVNIENLPRLRKSGAYIAPGSIITGSHQDGSWHFRIRIPYLRVRALWELTEWQQTYHQVWYLGEVTDPKTGIRRGIAEALPGVLTWLPSQEQTRSPKHLAVGDGNQFKGGIADDHQLRNHEPTLLTTKWQESGVTFRKVALLWLEGFLLGTCHEDSPIGSVNLTDVSLEMGYQRDSELVSLQRTFIVEAVHRTTGIKPATRKNVLDQSEEESDKKTSVNAEYQRKFDEYWANPSPLDGTFHRGVVRLKKLCIPSATRPNVWETEVPLLNNDGPFVQSAKYSAEAKVMLIKEGERYWASFREVLPLSVEIYRIKTGAPINVPVDISNNRLYYVGPEEFNPKTGEKYEEIYHRFEWGYGHTLLVPTSKLRYNDNPFELARLILFHSDEILKVTFTQKTKEKVITDEQGPISETEYLLNINQANIQSSPSRSLYNQRNQYKIVHVLHLLAYPTRVELQHVEGFDATQNVTEPGRFEPVNASLHEESLAGILKRLDEKQVDRNDRPVPLVCLGRLDVKDYEATLGMYGVRYHHVRFTFEESELGNPLHDSEMVFVQAGKIINWQNDTGLELYAIDALSKDILGCDDIGADMDRMKIHRRQFSVRENVLRDLQKNKGASGLEGIILLVRLDKKQSEVRASLVHGNIPTRLTRTLDSLIRKKRGSVFAAVKEKDPLELELQPGIYIRVPDSAIENELPKSLASGAIVMIENGTSRNDSKHRFIVTQAAYGHGRYIPSDNRVVVTFPKNDLLSPRVFQEELQSVFFWRRKTFTIGGFPNISAVPGYFHWGHQRWVNPRTEEFIRLMETPHPKLAILGCDENGQERVMPIPSRWEISVGKLGIDYETQKVFYISLLDELNKQDLYWSDLTYASESARETISRARYGRWTYHDQETGYWANDQVEKTPLQAHSCETGPLFFEESKSRRLTLRYSRQRLLEFGYPVDELFKAIKQKKNRTASFIVAAVSLEGGLWLELMPGYIVELPGHLVKWQQHAVGQSLKNFDWQAFAPGDSVELSLIANRGELFEVEEILLLRWQPSTRGLFGFNNCFLPVLPPDHENGAIILGCKQLQIKIPSFNPSVPWNTVVLDQDNGLDNGLNRWPKSGDVVVLTINEQGKIEICGLPDLLPIPHRPKDTDKWKWEEDPLADFIVVNTRNGLEFDYKRLQELLTCTGGVLPFTIEFAHREQKVAYLSRQQQTKVALLEVGRIGMATVQGYLRIRNKPFAVLRYGHTFLLLEINQIVSGVPGKFCHALVSTLKQKQTPIWLRRDENGHIVTGFHSERQDIQIKLLEVVEVDESESAQYGVLCRSVGSERLYWLPSKKIGWGSFASQLASEHFVERTKRKSITVRRYQEKKNTDAVSLIDVHQVAHELSNLKIGSELLARPLGLLSRTDDGVSEYIMESFTSGILFKCEVYDNSELELEVAIPVEVIDLATGHSPVLRVVPTGTKRQKVDLPSWMLVRSEFTSIKDTMVPNLLDWIQESPDLPDPKSIAGDTIRSVTEDQLKRWLCHAYTDYKESSADCLDRDQIRVVLAQEWNRRVLWQPELEVAYSLIAVLLLHETASRSNSQLLQVFPREVYDWRNKWLREATAHIQMLGQRSLRSLHSEIVARRWLHNAFDRTDGLWQRLQDLKHLLRTNLSPHEVRKILQFCYIVELRDNSDLLPIVRALRAALGDSVRIYSESEKASVTNRILDIYRTIPASRSTAFPDQWQNLPPLRSRHIGLIKTILHDITHNGWHIVLLDPLPFIWSEHDHEKYLEGMR